MVGEVEAKRMSFYFVYVPSDETKDLEEWEIALPDDKEAQVGCLTDRLRQHFKQGSASKSEKEQQEIFKQQLLSQLPKGATMTDDMLNMMLQMDSLVDSIPLILNTPDVQHVGLNMYVDDKGTAKGLPTNRRASAIVQACGKLMEVKGDAFIGRLFDNDDDFIRMDFRLAEVTSDAKWLQVAKAQSQRNPSGQRPTGPQIISRPQIAAQNICGAPLCSASGILRCSRCKKQCYCSAKCQKAHWKTHKTTCSSISSY